MHRQFVTTSRANTRVLIMNNMNDTINFCVKRLINEVQCRPAIWDSRIKEYSDRALKREAWDELCTVFVPHFHDASAAEKNGIGKYCFFLPLLFRFRPR